MLVSNVASAVFLFCPGGEELSLPGPPSSRRINNQEGVAAGCRLPTWSCQRQSGGWLAGMSEEEVSPERRLRLAVEELRDWAGASANGASPASKDVAMVTRGQVLKETPPLVAHQDRRPPST